MDLELDLELELKLERCPPDSLSCGTEMLSSRSSKMKIGMFQGFLDSDSLDHHNTS